MMKMVLFAHYAAIFKRNTRRQKHDNPHPNNKRNGVLFPMTKISTDSPYYEWASELMEIARTPQSCVTMRIAEKLAENLGDWIDAVKWCDECEEKCTGGCNHESRYNEGME